MKTLSIAGVIAALLVFSGCVRMERFRYVWDQPECFDAAKDPVPGAPGEKRDWASLDCRHRFYKLGFIEFDSQGSFIEPDQEAKVLRLIEHEKQRAPGGKIITVVYVHGWKNNGEQALPGNKPKDVERFQTALLELGYRARQASRTSPVPIVGVYIGWKGKSLMGPNWFTFASYWGRRNTANRVGDGPDLAQTLNRVIDKTNENSDASRVLFIGHSFGARLLEHAIETGKVTLFDPVPASGFVSPRVDLVLYVNSANDARLSMGRVQALRSRPITVRHPDYDPSACTPLNPHEPRCRSYPLLVAITSRGDSDTKYLLPAANRVNLDKGVPVPAQPADEFMDPPPSAGIYTRAAAGHLRFMQSHVVSEIICPDTSRPQCDVKEPSCRFAFATRGAPMTCYQVDDRNGGEARPPFNTTAFWIMAVDPPVIKDHGDIWNQSFVEMLGELTAPRGFFEADAKRVQIRLAPK
jgi:hypothetical protein